MAHAVSIDIENQWRTLTDTETERATALLDMAAILISHHVDLSGLTDEHPHMRVAKQVSIDMVIEALAPGTRGVSAYSVGLDGAVESATLRQGSDTSTITFTKGMRRLFGIGDDDQSPMGYFGDDAL